MANNVYSTFKPSEVIMKVKGVQIPMNNIQVCVVREWIFDIVPRLEVVFSDIFNITESVKLQQYDEIELSMKYDVDTKPNVNIKFIILTIEVSTTGSGIPVKIVQFTGVGANKSFFYDIKSRSFGQSNSSNVVNTVFSNNNLTNNTKDFKTNDTMNWMQCSVSDFEFLKHIKNRSYKSEEDSLFIYVDRKGLGNYVSLKDKANIKSKVNFKYVTTLLPEKEKIGEVSYSNFLYKNFMGISALSEGFADSVIQVGKDGGMEQTNFFDVSKKLNFISDNPYVYRTEKKFVRNSLQPRNTGNTYEQYFINKERKKLVERMFFSTMVVVSGLPHSSVNLMDVVNLEVPVAKTGANDISEKYSGDYLVGGMIHQLVGTNMYQCSYALFRNEEYVK